MADLANGKVRYLNRQRGAGTRILFDYHLGQGRHRTGPGRATTARNTPTWLSPSTSAPALPTAAWASMPQPRLWAWTVPLARERYDLVVPTAYLDDPKIQAVFTVVDSEAFKTRVLELGGYETDWTGRVMQPGMGLPDGK